MHVFAEGATLDEEDAPACQRERIEAIAQGLKKYDAIQVLGDMNYRLFFDMKSFDWGSVFKGLSMVGGPRYNMYESLRAHDTFQLALAQYWRPFGFEQISFTANTLPTFKRKFGVAPEIVACEHIDCIVATGITNASMFD